jgi:hypothetical protein
MELAGDFEPSAFEEAPPLRLLWSTVMVAARIDSKYKGVVIL